MENFGKNANVRGRWEYVALNKEEIEIALKELRESNYEQLNKIKLMTNDMETIKLLADKNLISAYTYLSAVIDKKIEAMKNPRPSQGTNYAGLKQQADSVPTGKSTMIDKAMEQKDE